jgi:hypothetical protein
VRVHPPQLPYRPTHNLPSHTNHLNFHLLHPLHLAYLPNSRVYTVIRAELARAFGLETAVGVFGAEVGAGSCGEEDEFSDGEVGG